MTWTQIFACRCVFIHYTRNAQLSRSHLKLKWLSWSNTTWKNVSKCVANVVCLIGHRSTSDDLYLCRKKLFTSPSPCDQFSATFFPISLRRGHAVDHGGPMAAIKGSTQIYFMRISAHINWLSFPRSSISLMTQNTSRFLSEVPPH